MAAELWLCGSFSIPHAFDDLQPQYKAIKSQPYQAKQETSIENYIFDAIIISKYYLFDDVCLVYL